MAVKSVYAPEPDPVDDVLTVEGTEHRHLRVSRTRAGEPVEVFDGKGGVWAGEVLEVGRHATRVRLGNARAQSRPEKQIILAQALIQGSQLAWVLEKCVELGVTRIVPFRAARSNSSEDLSRGRWRRIIVEAAKQSKRYHLPRLEAVRSFDEVLAIPAPSRVFFDERAGGPLEAALRGGDPVLYCVGPEGGWTDEERDAALAAGMAPVHLGYRILRAETAALTGAALIGYELGVFEP
jgi:16S rRNA (uracil1498-N3)-methyltransferase